MSLRRAFAARLSAVCAHVFSIAATAYNRTMNRRPTYVRRLMGIRFSCPNGHKLNVKEFLAGKRGVCPQCGAKFVIPMPPKCQLRNRRSPSVSGSRNRSRLQFRPRRVTRPQALRHRRRSSSRLPKSNWRRRSWSCRQPVRRPPIPIADGLPASHCGRPAADRRERPVGVAPEAVVTFAAERSRRNQMVISIVLLALVIVLAGVLIWVLRREANQTPVEKTTRSEAARFHQVFAMAERRLSHEYALTRRSAEQ